MSTKQDIAIIRGTTTVFEDLGYVDAGERQTKTRLAQRGAREDSIRRASTSPILGTLATLNQCTALSYASMRHMTDSNVSNNALLTNAKQLRFAR